MPSSTTTIPPNRINQYYVFRIVINNIYIPEAKISLARSNSPVSKKFRKQVRLKKRTSGRDLRERRLGRSFDVSYKYCMALGLTCSNLY